MERLDFQVDAYNPVEATIHLTRYLNAQPYVTGKRVLDAACGEGYGSALMKQWGAKSVVGVDISEEAVETAKTLFSKKGIEYLQHNVEELPFSDASFDMVVSLETIEHLDHPDIFLHELRRVVKEGGTIIISCPNDQYYADNVSDYSNPYHKRRYNFYEFREMAEKELGQTDCWYIGNAIAGFVNMPLSECNYPEKGDSEAPVNMMGMMNARQLTETFEVPKNKYMNSWNCVYYVGVWGAKQAQKNRSNASVYPVPLFFLYQNQSIPDSAKLANQWRQACKETEEKGKAEMRALSEKYQQFIYDLGLKHAEELHKLETEKNNIIIEEKRDIELISKERNLYAEQVTDLEKAQKELNETLIRQREENETLIAKYENISERLKETEDKQTEIQEEHRVLINERDRLYLLNDMQKKVETVQWNQLCALRNQNDQLYQEHLEYYGLKEAYAKLEHEIENMRNTRGWRVLEKVRKILRKKT